MGSLAAGQLFGVGGYVLVAVVGGLCALAPLAVLGRRTTAAKSREQVDHR